MSEKKTRKFVIDEWQTYISHTHTNMPSPNLPAYYSVRVEFWWWSRSNPNSLNATQVVVVAQWNGYYGQPCIVIDKQTDHSDYVRGHIGPITLINQPYEHALARKWTVVDLLFFRGAFFIGVQKPFVHVTGKVTIKINAIAWWNCVRARASWRHPEFSNWWLLQPTKTETQSNGRLEKEQQKNTRNRH